LYISFRIHAAATQVFSLHILFVVDKKNEMVPRLNCAFIRKN